MNIFTDNAIDTLGFQEHKKVHEDLIKYKEIDG